ncbi:MAG: hypothetical protein ABGY24_14015 [bacterium]|jgi:hypothetical protein
MAVPPSRASATTEDTTKDTTEDTMMTLMATCEAVLIAKNEEIDALRQLLERTDRALAEKNQLIHELATLLVDREEKLAAAIKSIDTMGRQEFAAEECRECKTVNDTHAVPASLRTPSPTISRKPSHL